MLKHIALAVGLIASLGPLAHAAKEPQAGKEHQAVQAAQVGLAVIENHCKYPIYIWSVPAPGKATPNTVPADNKYSEEYRNGTETNPGVALKISTQSNGIYEGKDELDFQYSAVPQANPAQVWATLNALRTPHQWEGGITYTDCNGVSTTVDGSVLPPCPINSTATLALCAGKATGKEDKSDSNGVKRHHWERVEKCE